MALKNYMLIGPIQTVIADDQRDWYVSWDHHVARAGAGRGGVDLVAVVGTPVVAPTAGTMVHVPNDGSAGNSSRFYHDDNSGWKDVFSHLSSYAAGSGQHFAVGQTIAYSGNTGGVTQHLHRHLLDPSNVRRNPKDYFSDSSTAGGGGTPLPPARDEDMMIRIQSTNRGIALVGAGYYRGLTSNEEVEQSGPLISAHYTGNDRQFDLWVAMAYGGQSSTSVEASNNFNAIAIRDQQILDAINAIDTGGETGGVTDAQIKSIADQTAAQIDVPREFAITGKASA